MPRGREYLPSHLTRRERRSPKLRRKLSSCIKQVEKANIRKGCPMYPRKLTKAMKRKKCVTSPAAICRAALR